MGITYVEAKVTNNGKEENVSFLVDSGATYTLLPSSIVKSLGLVPKRTMDFFLADGTKIKRNVSECYIILQAGECHTPVILGEESDTAILGVVTLEILGLVFNPFNRTLSPMKMLLV